MQISSSFNISFHSCLVFSFSIGSIFHRAVDFDDMKEFIRDEEINQLQGVVIADMGDIDSLCDAFRGCHAITMKPAYWKAKILNFYRVSVLAKKLVPVLFFIYFKRTVG